MAKIEHGDHKSEFEVVDPKEFETLLSYTRSIFSVKVFSDIARRYMPSEDIFSAANPHDVKKSFERAFARSDKETRQRVLEALRDNLMDEYDSKG